MAGIPEWVKRRQISDGLRADFEATIEERVSRYIEVSHQPIIPNRHFAEASTQCILLYRDGYFFSVVMVTQAVAEGISNFVVKRNEIKPDNGMTRPQVADLLVKSEIISSECAEAFKRIWGSFRNDVHHMNPKVAEISFPELAKRNIQDLATIEREIFSSSLGNGMLNPKYCDLKADGTTEAFLRLEP